MMLRKILLGTTAVVGAGMAVVASPSSARSAEVLPGGYPDIELTGFARFEAFGGEQDDLALNSEPVARPRLPQRHRGPRHRPRQERGERPRIWCHDRVRGRHQQHPQHRRDLDLPPRRLGRDPAGRRGRRGRQQRGRWPDPGGRHGRYRRLGCGDRRGTVGVPVQQQRRDQGPLLHAELRRPQLRRQLHADPGEPQQRRQQRPVLRQQGRRPGHGRPEHLRGRPRLQW